MLSVLVIMELGSSTQEILLWLMKFAMARVKLALLYDWKPMDISEYVATGSQSDAKRYECLKRTLLNFNFRPLDDVQYFFACFLKLKQNPS